MKKNKEEERSGKNWVSGAKKAQKIHKRRLIRAKAGKAGACGRREGAGRQKQL